MSHARLSNHLQAAMASAVLATIVLTGCGLTGTVGSGPAITEDRTVAAFDRVEVDNGIAVDIHVGTGQTVQIQAQQEVLSRIATDVAGGVLKIHHASAFVAAETPHVIITMPTLNGAAINGGSQMTADGIAADTFAASLNGGLGLTAAGTTNTLNPGGNGGGPAEVFRLLAQNPPP